MKQNKKLLLTGGHAGTTAIALVQSLRTIDHAISFYWIGAKRATEGTNHATIESKYLPLLDVQVSSITAGKLQTKFTLWTIPSLLKLPFGFISAFIELLRIKPDGIVSFGGYTAFPVVVCGWLMGKPIIIHDQTVAAGRANQFSAPFAKRVAIARDSSLPYFPKSKTIVVGNPVMEQIHNVAIKKKLSTPPTIFVTGGSRGSLRLNEAFYKILPKILKRYRIIHITGERGYEEAQNIYAELPPLLQKNYTILSQVSPFEMHQYWEKADIIIARSGANTVSEVLTTVRPTIFIPLPYTYLDEQVKNARFVERNGLAKVVLEGDLDENTLLAALNFVHKNWGDMVQKGLVSRFIDRDAAKKLAELVIHEVWNNKHSSL